MAGTINTIHVGGIDKEIEDTVARETASSASSTVASVTNRVSTLETRVEQIIAPTGTAPNPAEVVDARQDIYGQVNTSLGAAIRKQLQLSIPSYSEATGSNVDFNDFSSGTRRVYGTTNARNSPVEDPFGFVITTNDTEDADNQNAKTQIYIGYRFVNVGYIRYSSRGSWTEWTKFASGKAADEAYAAISGHLELTGSGVDFDTLERGYYRAYNLTNPQHAPTDNVFGFLIVANDVTNDAGTVSVKTQVYIHYGSNKMFIRYETHSTGWTPWRSVIGEYDQVVTVNPGDNLYTKLKGISDNTHVIINAGTYDISSAVEATSDTDYDGDIHVKPGCWIEGRGTPTIICRLSAKRTWTSVFMFDYGDGKISGVKVVAKNTRYTIHDDTANNIATSQFTHVIENCILSYESSEGPTQGRTIGGGLGANVTNIVRNNIIESDTNNYPIHYHTSSVVVKGDPVVAPAKLEITNNWLATGGIVANALSNDQGVSRDVVIITGNRARGGVIIENNSAGTIKPYVWDNETEN